MKATDKYQSNRFASVDELIQALDNLAFVSSVVGDSVFAGSNDAEYDPILNNNIDDYDEEEKPRKKQNKNKDKKDNNGEGGGKKKVQTHSDGKLRISLYSKQH